MTIKIFLFSLAIVIFHSAISQNKATIWYFGDSAGVKFNSGKPLAITNSHMNALEGCATISTENGRLLFYTDGLRVWDSAHSVTPNGEGLMSTFTSTQSVLIVPKPGTTKQFYIFTAASEYSKGFRYSLFDMSLNSGKGDIVSSQKNILLLNFYFEKNTAVPHTNGKDFWVLTNKCYNADTIYAWLVTSDGVNSKPVKSATGLKLKITTIIYTAGYLRVSPDGTKIAYANYDGDTCGFGNFDANTGKVSNVWPFLLRSSYGVEFSASGKYLYLSENNFNRFAIYQFNAKAKDKASFLASQKKVDDKNGQVGALQLGPDKRIYITRVFSKYLDVISSPELEDTFCKVIHNYVYLSGKKCMHGLPNFIQSYFRQNILYNESCYGDTAWFSIADSNETDSVHWNFGDKTSGIKNIATGNFVYHLFSGKGSYLIQSISFKGHLFDTTYLEIMQNKTGLQFTLGNDTTFPCNTPSVKLGHFNQEYTAYQWNNQSTDAFIYAISSGTYWVRIKDKNGCYKADTINIAILKMPKVNLTQDLIGCDKVPLLLNISNSKNHEKYLWSTGDTTSVMSITKAGKYWVKAKNDCGQDSINFNVTLHQKSIPDFSMSDVCETDSVTFTNKSTNATNYQWKFGDGEYSTLRSPKHHYKINGLSQTFNVTLVSILSGGCSDSIVNLVTVNANPKSDFTYTASSNQWNFTPNQSGNTKYRWKFGDGDSSLTGIVSHSYKDGLSTHTVCLKATNAANCISETCKLIATTGIYHAQLPGFKIYPNPNTGNFTIEIDNPEKDILIEVYNAIGKRVEMVEMLGKVTEINLGVAAGIYLVKVKNGEMVYNQKVSITK